LKSMAVIAARRGEGIGRALVEAAIAGCRARGAWPSPPRLPTPATCVSTSARASACCASCATPSVQRRIRGGPAGGGHSAARPGGARPRPVRAAFGI